MRILFGDKWKEGFLDYHRNPTEYRIEVLAWRTLEELRDVYHVRPKNLKMPWNYLPVVGPGGLLRKIWSRIREDYRNQKYTSCGIGRIIEVPSDNKFATGPIIGFIAPMHPKLVERIVLPKELIFQFNKSKIPEVPPHTIFYCNDGKESQTEGNEWWKEIRGWSTYSGIPIPTDQQERISRGAKKILMDTNWESAQRFSTDGASKVSETKGEFPKKESRGKNGVLFGYGNYPKINNIPYSKPYVHIRTVHEIDPTEMLWEWGVERWDTSPMPRLEEKHEVCFIASYNHTHVPLAIHGLNQGAYVIMEKPIATDHSQLNELADALKRHDGKIFIGFQKRYSIFNDWARKDLGVKPEEPISYHCIVFEIIQPKFFWYNWPSSKSRLFSNGCHLVDHFLYLNGFSEPTSIDLAVAGDGTINVWIELENGAFFTMVFTEKGSSRVGPRDHIELKTPGRNVRITDAIRYFSENEHEILRKKRVFKTEAYKRMYKTISKKIARGEKGDSFRSVMVSAKTMLVLEERLQDVLRGRHRNQIIT